MLKENKGKIGDVELHAIDAATLAMGAFEHTSETVVKKSHRRSTQRRCSDTMRAPLIDLHAPPPTDLPTCSPFLFHGSLDMQQQVPPRKPSAHAPLIDYVFLGMTIAAFAIVIALILQG